MAGGGQKPRLGQVRALGLVPGVFQRGRNQLVFGNVRKGDDHPLHPAAVRQIGEYPAQEPYAPGRCHLALDRRADGGGSGQHLAGVRAQFRIGRDGGEIGEGPADVARDNVELRLHRWREETDLQVHIQKQRADIGAVQHILQIVRGQPLAFQGFLQLAVQRGQFLVERLQFLLRGQQFLIGGLKLLIDRKRLLVDRLLLLVTGLLALDSELQFGLRRLQFAFKFGDARGLGMAGGRRMCGVLARILRQGGVGSGERLVHKA